MDDSMSPQGLSAIDPKRLKELSRRSNASGLAQLASHWSALLLTGVGVSVAHWEWIVTTVRTDAGLSGAHEDIAWLAKPLGGEA